MRAMGTTEPGAPDEILRQWKLQATYETKRKAAIRAAEKGITISAHIAELVHDEFKWREDANRQASEERSLPGMQS